MSDLFGFLSGLQWGGVEPAVVSGYEALQLSHKGCFEAPAAEERGEFFQHQGVLKVTASQFGYSSRLLNPKRGAVCPLLYFGKRTMPRA